MRRVAPYTASTLAGLICRRPTIGQYALWHPVLGACPPTSTLAPLMARRFTQSSELGEIKLDQTDAPHAFGATPRGRVHDDAASHNVPRGDEIFVTIRNLRFGRESVIVPEAEKKIRIMKRNCDAEVANAWPNLTNRMLRMRLKPCVTEGPCSHIAFDVRFPEAGSEIKGAKAVVVISRADTNRCIALVTDSNTRVALSEALPVGTHCVLDAQVEGGGWSAVNCLTTAEPKVDRDVTITVTDPPPPQGGVGRCRRIAEDGSSTVIILPPRLSGVPSPCAAGTQLVANIVHLAQATNGHFRDVVVSVSQAIEAVARPVPVAPPTPRATLRCVVGIVSRTFATALSINPDGDPVKVFLGTDVLEKTPIATGDVITVSLRRSDDGATERVTRNVLETHGKADPIVLRDAVIVASHPHGQILEAEGKRIFTIVSASRAESAAARNVGSRYRCITCFKVAPESSLLFAPRLVETQPLLTGALGRVLTMDKFGVTAEFVRDSGVRDGELPPAWSATARAKIARDVAPERGALMPGDALLVNVHCGSNSWPVIRSWTLATEPQLVKQINDAFAATLTSDHRHKVRSRKPSAPSPRASASHESAPPLAVTEDTTDGSFLVAMASVGEVRRVMTKSLPGEVYVEAVQAVVPITATSFTPGTDVATIVAGAAVRGDVWMGTGGSFFLRNGTIMM